jgi:tetratricopeptide (TPR) repeat protein
MVHLSFIWPLALAAVMPARVLAATAPDPLFVTQEMTSTTSETTLAQADTTLAQADTTLAPADTALARADTALAQADTALAPADTSPARAENSAAEPAAPPAGSVEDLIRKGDDAMARLAPTRAMEFYQAAVARDPRNHEALWKAGRTLIDLGELEEKGNSQKDKYNKALKYAERAIQMNPDGADGHFVRAYALARVALFEGGRTKIRLSKEVKAEALRAVDLNPLHDGAYHILGMWNYDVADLNFIERAIANTLLGGVPKDASFENAAHYYELALQANPDNIHHHLEYARTLLRLGRREEARSALQTAVDLPGRDLDDPAHKQEAKNLLRKLG